MKENTVSIFYTSTQNGTVLYKKPTDTNYNLIAEGNIISDLPSGTKIKIVPVALKGYNLTLYTISPTDTHFNSKTYNGTSTQTLEFDFSHPNKLYNFFVIAIEITFIFLILYVIGLLFKGSTEKIASPIIYIVIIGSIFIVRSYLNYKSTTEFYNNSSIARSSSNTVNPSVEKNYSPVTTVDPTVDDTSVIHTEPPVHDAAGILNSQANEKNNQINNSSNTSNDISAQDVENIISKGLDIISYLNKSNEWESRTFPFRCTKCGESCTASGYYKERTDQFVPNKDAFPTRWFHTHTWERLK